MIGVRDLSKAFAGRTAVDGVTFTVRTGSLTILAGADGAGKSTLIKMILGLVRMDSGRIELRGAPLRKDFSRLTAVTGYMPERFSLYTDLTVEENLNFFVDIHRVPRSRREELKARLLNTTGMSDFRGRKAGALSGGMKQKLALSSILLSSPDLILLDEPTTGVDPLSRIEFFNIIGSLKAEGKTILASTPYLEEAEKGDDIIFLKRGRILRQGPIKTLKKEFPGRLFRIRPEGHILDVMRMIENRPRPKSNLYVRGQFLMCITTDLEPDLGGLPVREVREVPAGLEDIYLFYERREGAAGGH